MDKKFSKETKIALLFLCEQLQRINDCKNDFDILNWDELGDLLLSYDEVFDFVVKLTGIKNTKHNYEHVMGILFDRDNDKRDFHQRIKELENWFFEKY